MTGRRLEETGNPVDAMLDGALHDAARSATSTNGRRHTARPFGTCYASLLENLQSAINRRVESEKRLATLTSQGADEQEQELDRALRALHRDHDQWLTEHDAAHEQAREALDAALSENESQVQRLHMETVREIESRHNAQADELQSKYEDSAWVASSVLDDESEDSPKRQFDRFRQTRERTEEQQSAEWERLQAAYQSLADERRWRETPIVEPDEQPRNAEQAQQLFAEHAQAAHENLEYVRTLKTPRLFIGYRPLIVFAILLGACFVPVLLFADPAWIDASGRFDPIWIGASAAAAAAASLILIAIVYMIGSAQQSEALQQLQTNVSTAAWLHQRWSAIAEREIEQQRAAFQKKQAEFEAQRQAALDRYQQAHQQQRQEIEHQRSRELTEENARYARQQEQLKHERERSTHEIEQHAGTQREQAVTAFEAENRRLTAALDGRRQDKLRERSELSHRLKADWESALADFDAASTAAQVDSRARFQDWEQIARGEWIAPTDVPSGIRIGSFPISLADWEHAISEDIRLAPRTTRHALPAVAPFPESPSILLKTRGGASRDAAINLLQSALLRMLTLIPPGKLRFTFLDPVGLGESFAGFMHLADYDELLVTKRIWTEPGQIEEQLADLTEHMEHVLQKYLRNEFTSIEQYNEYAGEVAEPYRILVVTDFPSKFSEIAARRLTSVVTSGPRCGVYTLMSLDTTLDQPHGFKLSTLEEHLPTLAWRDGDFYPGSGPVADWPLTVDQPPPPELFTAIVKRVGEASKDARRVEVAFNRIAPPDNQLWHSSSRDGLQIPLGRAGATKLQSLRLGRGTSQHMLIAGKTGSGKSTFLHCLVTNLALYYSPDEVRFCLIDFKKGVEFKTYAAARLPHADVIAIESDREFGVSALQRLDALLQERGELFRKHHVQDLAGFRDASPETPMPRILLVIDEFQEFFVEDDKLSQTASLLLDRLVRQGRAFGIHVVLGSQTLGGAYSLARSTLGQVAVRIALQCSESDAHLILSEENTAARLLTRPGEAIYNDANGLLEGNHPFQVAWLPDEERDEWLRKIAQRASELGRQDPAAIVFEGNVPSDPAQNAELTRLLRTAQANRDQDAPRRAPTIWLGDAVEIREPTAVTFRQQSGANLLIVGQDAEAAHGILTTAAVTLSAQLGLVGSASNPPSQHPPRVVVLDGSPNDTPTAQDWHDLSNAIGGGIQVAHPSDAPAVLAQFTAERERRTTDPDAPATPWFLLVSNLGRFRDLRKSDDDFGLGSFGSASEDKPVKPAQLFADLLAEGPPTGLHVVIWSDSYNNVDRWFSRQTMRELELRVAFQMNTADSSNLIDNPSASRLGVHRALLYREETGTSEKFRPYRRPPAQWLQPAQSNNPSADLKQAQSLDEFRIL